jgi:Uma2 family endonuclease
VSAGTIGQETGSARGRSFFFEVVMATITVARNQRFVLFSEPWKTYVGLRRVFQDRPGIRITYDRGFLELVTLTHEHEHFAFLLARLVVAWTEERSLPLKGGGSTTFRRRDLARGLEPDECYWIAHETAVRNVNRIDLRRDPPPDLVIEVEVTRSSARRMPIYAALNFPEVWRLAGTTLTFNALQTDGTYAPTGTSAALAPLTPTDLTPFLALGGQTDDNSIVAQFRAWVRQLPKSPPSP